MRLRHDKNSQSGHFWECRHEFAHDPTRGSSRRRDDFSRRLKLEDDPTGGSSRRRDDFSRRLKLEDETSRDRVSLSNVD